MKRIELTVNTKKLGFVLLLNMMSIGTIIGLIYGRSIEVSLFVGIVLSAALIITAFLTGMIYFYQPRLILDNNGIRTSDSGYNISYKDITKVELGPGAMRISAAGRSVIISNFYTNYQEAADLLHSRLQNRNDVTVVKSSFFGNSVSARGGI